MAYYTSKHLSAIVEKVRGPALCALYTRRKGQRSARLCISRRSQLCILTFTAVKSSFLKWLRISHNKCQQIHNRAPMPSLNVVCRVLLSADLGRNDALCTEGVA